MRPVLQLLRIEWKASWRRKTIPAMLVALLLLYGAAFGMNVSNYRESVARLQVDAAEGFFFRVPLVEPMKNFGYVSNFTPYQFPSTGQRVSRTGLLLLPDRSEEAGTSTRYGRWFFVSLAAIVLLLGHREMVNTQRKQLDTYLLTAPVRRGQIFSARMILGGILAGMVFVQSTLIAGGISALCNLNLSLAQCQQIIAYNACMAWMVFLLYGLSLAISADISQEGMALLKMVLLLATVVYLLPAFLEIFRDLIYSQLPQGWRAEWFWYSRYLQGLDIFGSYSEFTSDLLYLGRARVFFASLPWTESMVGAGPLSVGRLLLIQWYRWTTMVVWAIIVYAVAGRRFWKSNVV